MSLTCTCTSGPRCDTCRPPCQWVVSHLGEVPVRCGDQFATFFGTLPVCLDHYEFSRLDTDDGVFVNTAGVW
jgi:hypothetical protein